MKKSLMFMAFLAAEPLLAQDVWENRHSLMPADLMRGASFAAPASKVAVGGAVAPVPAAYPVISTVVDAAPAQPVVDAAAPAGPVVPAPPAAAPFQMRSLEEMSASDKAGLISDIEIPAAPAVVPAQNQPLPVEPPVVLRPLDNTRDYFAEPVRPQPQPEPSPASGPLPESPMPPREDPMAARIRELVREARALSAAETPAVLPAPATDILVAPAPSLTPVSAPRADTEAPIVSSTIPPVITRMPASRAEPAPLSAPMAPSLTPAPVRRADARARMHVASYGTMPSAERGVAELQRAHAELSSLDGEILLEDVPGKGMFYRVYFLGTRDVLRQTCNILKNKGLWCSVNR